MFHIPKSEGVQEELEFKKNSTWSTTLGLWHVCLPVCGRKSQASSSRHIVVCLLAKNLMKLSYICTCVFFDIWYFRVRVSLRMRQEIYRLVRYLPLVQRKYIFRIYVSELITTQSSSPYTSRARINLDGHSNYITDTACQLVTQYSHVVTCVQIFYAWKLGDFMNRLD